MRDLQTICRGEAPDPRGPHYPLEIVYETERPSLARQLAVVWGVMRGSVIVSLIAYGAMTLALRPFGIDLVLPEQWRETATIALGAFLPLWAVADWLASKA